MRFRLFSNDLGIDLGTSNVLGVYRMAKGTDVRDKRILLLDDVMTTGATAGEAARILLTAGAREVHLGCIAAAATDQK